VYRVSGRAGLKGDTGAIAPLSVKGAPLKQLHVCINFLGTITVLVSIHKRCLHKIAKKLTTFHCPQNFRTASPPLLVTHHNLRKILNFLLQKVRTSTLLSAECVQLTTPPLTADVFYRQLLIENKIMFCECGENTGEEGGYRHLC